MSNQPVFTATRRIAISKTLTEIEAYLNELADELSAATLPTEEKVRTLKALEHTRKSTRQLRDTLDNTKK